MLLKPESATLYRAAISLGAQEAQLIWTPLHGLHNHERVPRLSAIQ